MTEEQVELGNTLVEKIKTAQAIRKELVDVRNYLAPKKVAFIEVTIRLSIPMDIKISKADLLKLIDKNIVKCDAEIESLRHQLNLL